MYILLNIASNRLRVIYYLSTVLQNMHQIACTSINRSSILTKIHAYSVIEIIISCQIFQKRIITYLNYCVTRYFCKVGSISRVCWQNEGALWVLARTNSNVTIYLNIKHVILICNSRPLTYLTSYFLWKIPSTSVVTETSGWSSGSTRKEMSVLITYRFRVRPVF